MSVPPGGDRAADDSRTTELAGRLEETRSRLDAARAAAGRSDDVALMVVTKFHPLDDAIRLARLGATLLGENRAQEAAAKAAGLSESTPDLAAGVRWSMIGHVQSKKTGGVAAWADSVQSVDSAKVADGLDRGRARAIDEGVRAPGERLEVLLQLSLDGDTARGGVTREDLPALAEHVAGLGNLTLRGLMVVPPLEGDAAAHLADAAAVHELLRADHPGAGEFSAGMSADLEEAVAAGSTCVRVGTAILGPRPLG